ncbi:lazarillo protein [Folsomia candida]|uniref:lazarillo protein n=1 Tax=Folsomia candida TaxID=158441 RepID=UPI001604ED7B|nr:lazarillo protein [Folsomia candida]
MRGLGSAHFLKLKAHSPISPTVRIRYKMTYFFKNAKLLYIFLVFFVDVKSQLFFPGPCPTPTPLPNINITRYSGTWYLYQTYASTVQLFFSCQLGEYYPPRADGTWDGVTRMTERMTGNIISVPGTVKFFSTDGSAVFTSDNHLFSGNLPNIGINSPAGVTLTINYIVLATDYSSYAVEWTCYDFGISNFQFLWIFSRGATISQSNLQNIRKALNSQRINSAWLRDQDLSGCHFL